MKSGITGFGPKWRFVSVLKEAGPTLGFQASFETTWKRLRLRSGIEHKQSSESAIVWVHT